MKDRFIEDELIVLTYNVTHELFAEKQTDALALYVFYYAKAKRDKTNRPWSTTEYTAAGLGWSEARVRKAKKVLIAKGLIEDYVDQKNDGTVGKHYIWIKYKFTASAEQEIVHTYENPQGGENHSVDSEYPSAYSISNLNAYSINKEKYYCASADARVLSDCPKDKETYEKEFEALWQLYPRKAGRKTALAAYMRARKHGTTDETIKAGILRYVAYIKARGIDPQYIMQGSTYFNGARWDDNYNDSTIEESKTKGRMLL